MVGRNRRNVRALSRGDSSGYRAASSATSSSTYDSALLSKELKHNPKPNHHFDADVRGDQANSSETTAVLQRWCATVDVQNSRQLVHEQFVMQDNGHGCGNFDLHGTSNSSSTGELFTSNGVHQTGYNQPYGWMSSSTSSQPIAYTAFIGDTQPPPPGTMDFPMAEQSGQLSDGSANVSTMQRKTGTMQMDSFKRKRPVTFLLESLLRCGLSVQYALIQIDGPVHAAIFRFSVTVCDYVEYGEGKSKMEAKHAAAQAMIDNHLGEILNGAAQMPKPSSSDTDAPQTTDGTVTKDYSADMTKSTDYIQRMPPSATSSVHQNAVGWVYEQCLARHWPEPVYRVDFENGMPHNREFSMSCLVQDLQTSGTGRTKRQAKQAAAHLMRQAIIDADIQSGGPTMRSSHASRHRSIRLNSLSSGDRKIVTNFYQKLREDGGSEHLRLLHETALPMANAGTSGEPDTTTVPTSAVQLLHNIARENSFEVAFLDGVENVQTTTVEAEDARQHHCIVQLALLPVTAVVGYGPTAESAQQEAAANTLRYLKIMTKP